jgi:cobalt-zinc-cadmium efflux system protein
VTQVPDHSHGGHSADHHGHAHSPKSFGAAFAIGIGLNTAFVLIEAAFGIFSNSMALLADAGHNLSDVLGLLVAWVATVLSRRAPSPRFTYGLGASSILAALFNAVFLLVAVGAIGWEAILRLVNPQPVAGLTVIVVAAIGIVINGITAWLFASGEGDDLNLRAAYMHMLSDALVSAGVVAGGLLILLTGWLWIDPVLSIIVVGVIVAGAWGLLRDGMALSLSAVPPGIDPGSVRDFLASRPGVARLHDLHIWPMSTTETALTAHLVMPAGHPGDAALMGLAREMNERFGIEHVTLQVETELETACRLEPDHLV